LATATQVEKKKIGAKKSISQNKKIVLGEEKT
jgi:hypothetical protein